MDTATTDPARDLDRLVDEAALLMRHAGQTGGAALDGAQEELSERLRRLRARLDAADETARASARRHVEAVHRSVREHPYAAIGAAAALGILVGALVARR